MEQDILGNWVVLLSYLNHSIQLVVLFYIYNQVFGKSISML